MRPVTYPPNRPAPRKRKHRRLQVGFPLDHRAADAHIAACRHAFQIDRLRRGIRRHPDDARKLDPVLPTVDSARQIGPARRGEACPRPASRPTKRDATPLAVETGAWFPSPSAEEPTFRQRHGTGVGDKIVPPPQDGRSYPFPYLGLAPQAILALCLRHTEGGVRMPNSMPPLFGRSATPGTMPAPGRVAGGGMELSA